MLNSEFKGALLKGIEQYGFVRVFLFRKNTNAIALLKNFSGAFVDPKTTFGAAAVYHNGGTLLDVAKKRDFDQFFFSHKHKGLLGDKKHQHNIDIAGMIGDK